MYYLQMFKLHMATWRQNSTCLLYTSYYSFAYCISGYLKSLATKRFEKYNDSVFDIIGYLSDWGFCCSGAYDAFDFYRQKTSDEFRSSVTKELSKRFDENPDVRTSVSVGEIDLEFRNSRR